MLKQTLIACLALLLTGTQFTKTWAQAPGSDSAQVAATMVDFITVFSNLEWDKFTAFFADSATAFFPPSAHFSGRANNKAEIEAVFKKFFDAVKKPGVSAPYLHIQPEGLKIEVITQIAIVTFTLSDPGLLGRRTIVLQKINGRWLIIHLHASGVPTAA